MTLHDTCFPDNRLQLVECHPATTSAPAIYVEDEAKEIPASEPKPYGMNSFLSMDDDDDDDDGDGDGGENDNAKHARRTSDQGAGLKVEQVPPYDTSTGTSVNFSSAVIGTTVRRGAFLSVPGQSEDNLSDPSPESEMDITCAVYDGNSTTPYGSSYDTSGSEMSSSESEWDIACMPYDGILTVPPGSCDDSGLEMACSPYDGILTVPPGSFGDACKTLSSGSQSDLTCSPYDGVVIMPSKSSDDSGMDFACSPYDGISTAPSGPPEDAPRMSLCDPMSDLTRSPYDGIDVMPQRPFDDPELDRLYSPHEETLCSPPGSELDYACSPYDGILTTPPRSSCSPKRYGMADMTDLMESLQATIPEAGYALTRTISHRGGLWDLSEFVETDSGMSRGSLDQLDVVNDKEMGSRDDMDSRRHSAMSTRFLAWCADDKANTSSSDIDAGVHDSLKGLRKGSRDRDTFAALYEGLDLMQKLLDELRDPTMECNPRAICEYSDSEYGEDEDGKGSIPSLVPTRGLEITKRIPLESTCPSLTSSGNVSDDGQIYPLTPPSRTVTSMGSAPAVQKDYLPSLVTGRFNGEGHVMSPTPSGSHGALPSKAHFRNHRDSRLLMRGRSLLAYLA